jgi:hypothetical protein
MSAEIERPQRPRLTFPYWLALILFLVTLASAILLGGQFILSPEYREARMVYGGVTVATALLLWLWVLGSTRRFRKREFAGPIQTVRGADSPFQPITALVFLAIAAYLAYSITIPIVGHALADQRTVGYDFAIAGEPDAPRRGCAKVKATQDFYGETTICVPDDILVAGTPPPPALRLTGRRSEFGFWPERYEVASSEGPVRKVAPAKDTTN